MGTTFQTRCMFWTIMLLLTCALCACDPAVGKRPFDYPNSKWVCSEPHIEIEVSVNGDYTATLGTGGEKRTFFLGFRSGYGVDAYTGANVVFNDETLLFTGECSYSKDRFIVTIGDDNLWDGAYHKLVFVRVE